MKFLLPALCLFFSFNVIADSKVLATVNGNEITQAAVDNFMQHLKKTTTLKDALSEMITIETLVTHRLKSPIEQDSLLQLELERNRKAIIAANTLETMLSRFQMSEETLNEEYKKQYLSVFATQEYNANHILVETQEEAYQIIQSLDEKLDFEKLAKKHSTGNSSKTGGALGWFNLNKMVKPFSKAVTTLKKGEYSKSPTKTQFGWHVIKLNDFRHKAAPTLKSVAAKIKRQYSALKLSEEIQNLYKTADIVVGPKK